MKTNRREFFQSATALGAAPILGASVAATEPSIWPRVLSVADEHDRVVIETTGAIFSISRGDPAKIDVTQKINGPRRLYSMEVGASFADLTVDYHDAEQCVLCNPVGDFCFNLRVMADSLLVMRAGKAVRVITRGEWLPEYSYAEAGNLLYLDRVGGFGQYLIPSAHPYGSAFEETKLGVSFSSNGWETYAQIPPARRVLVCVAPPRPPDSRSAVADRIVHHFIADRRADQTWNYYPSDSSIKTFARRGNILTLHAWSRGAGPYHGKEVKNRTELYAKAAPWAAWRYEPVDAAELSRVVQTAHNAGMRVLPYMSPLFFPGNSHEFLAELQRVLETHGFDGVYYDGIADNILDAYETMKGTRRIVGEKGLLYAHIPSPILGSSYRAGKYVYCPFIDTYANFILRSEHIDTFDDKVLRYTISGHNISNAIGYACNYDYNLDFNRELIRRVLDYDVRVPYWVGWDIYLKDRGKAVGKQYAAESALQEVMEQVYFPALDRLEKKHAK